MTAVRRKNLPKLPRTHHQHLVLLGLSVAMASPTGNRERAPFIPDNAEAVMFKLLRKKYVEVEYVTTPRGKHRATFRPSSRGWAVYDQWLKEAT